MARRHTHVCTQVALLQVEANRCSHKAGMKQSIFLPFQEIKQIILKTELEKERKTKKTKKPHFFFSPSVCALNSKTQRTSNISGLIQQPLSQREHHRCLQEALEWALRATDLQQHGCVCIGSRQFRTGFMKRMTNKEKKKKTKKGQKNPH